MKMIRNTASTFSKVPKSSEFSQNQLCKRLVVRTDLFSLNRVNINSRPSKPEICLHLTLHPLSHERFGVRSVSTQNRFGTYTFSLHNAQKYQEKKKD